MCLCVCVWGGERDERDERGERDERDERGKEPASERATHRLGRRMTHLPRAAVHEDVDRVVGSSADDPDAPDA